MGFDKDLIDWWYVNLASRPDRRVHAESQFATVDIVPQRLEAFTPNQWRGTPTQVTRMLAKNGGTPGAIGCYHSQTEIIQKAIDTDSIVAVCEDDVCFCRDFQKRLQYIATNVPDEWDIFYLGATFHVPGQWCHRQACESWGSLGVDVEPTTNKHILRTYGIWGTYAYLVNGKNARKVFELFEENLHRSRGIDHLAIILGPQLNSFCFVPGCCWQYDSESNIGIGITKFSNFKKLGPYSWTDKLEDFDPTTFDWRKR